MRCGIGGGMGVVCVMWSVCRVWCRGEIWGCGVWCRYAIHGDDGGGGVCKHAHTCEFLLRS